MYLSLNQYCLFLAFLLSDLSLIYLLRRAVMIFLLQLSSGNPGVLGLCVGIGVVNP